MKTAPTKPTRTKRVLALSAALSLLAWGTTDIKADDILFNGTLDILGPANTVQVNACPAGWNVVACRAISNPGCDFRDGGDSETFCNVSPPSDPAGYGFFFKPFQGSITFGIEDLLNVYLYQDNDTVANNSFTISFNAAGEANFCAFFNTNSPPPGAFGVIEFLNSSGTMIASNAFDLVAAGLPNGGPGSMGNFVFTSPSVTAPAGTTTVRAGASLFNAYGTSGGQSFFVDNFVLNATAPPGSPIITNQPSAATVSPGGTAHFTVGISNPTGVSYQWQLYNTNLSNSGEFSGVNTATLTVSPASTADVGHYRVLVSNAAGGSYSSSVPLALQSLNFFPVVLLTGKSGDTYRVDYATTLTPTPNWTPLSTNKLTSATQMIIDAGSPGSNTRFYRSVFLH